MIDIDDTLYDYGSAHKAAINQVFNKIPRLNEEFNYEDFLLSYRLHRTEVTDKHCGSGATRSRLLAFQALFEVAKFPSAYNLALDAEEVYWGKLLECMRPIPLVIEMVKRVHLLKKPICAVTDMQAKVQIQKIRQLGLVNEITYLTTSEEAGCEKPNPRIFRVALDKVGLQAKDVVMIGDSLEKDIQGANRIGMDTWLVKDLKLHRVK